MAWLLLPGPLVVACVYDGSGSSAGAGEATTSTTLMIASPATGTTDATTGAVPTTDAQEPESGPTTGAVEPATTTSTSTTTGTGTSTTTDADDGDDALGFESDIAPILADYCTCHGDGSPSPDLGIGRAYDNIVREPADDVEMVLVEPGWPNHSYLWHKIAGTHEEIGGDGKRMPPNDELLDTDMDLIEAWIAQGALP